MPSKSKPVSQPKSPGRSKHAPPTAAELLSRDEIEQLRNETREAHEWMARYLKDKRKPVRVRVPLLSHVLLSGDNHVDRMAACFLAARRIHVSVRIHRAEPACRTAQAAERQLRIVLPMPTILNSLGVSRILLRSPDERSAGSLSPP